jgi:hypothetical protein
MLSNEQCQFLDPFTDEKWAYPIIPRSFWPAEPREGGSELLENQLNDWAEARGILAKEWAKARAESIPDSQMQQLNLAGTEQKVDSNEEGVKSPAMRLEDATNLVKTMQDDASKARRAALIKEYLASQKGTSKF